jgi:cell division protein FtsI/penicillin-binding protein 2
LVPIAALAGVAFVIGVVAGSGAGDDRTALAERYARAWAAGDYARMYRDITPAARVRIDVAAFARRHRAALELATSRRVILGDARREGDIVAIPVVIPTRIFGTIRAELDLPVEDGGGGPHVAWRANLVFPGLRPGEALTRRTELPPRATIEARDGSVLAAGSDRLPAGDRTDVAADTVGQLGPIPPERMERLRALGVPDDAQVGQSGLERALDERLIGHPGGSLLAGGRVLGHSSPRRAHAVRTTIAPSVERAAIAGLAGRLGGVVALDPRTGELLAFAGIAFSGLQPPGSTFKMITLTAALEAGAVKPEDTFPVQTAATLSGVELENANGESCGGTLAESFAESCNSVFAPLGAKLGARKLVDMAERFGFNAPSPIAGAATSTLPPANEIGDDLAVGSTAIGQGRVQATALQMAIVAASIGLRGNRPVVTLDLDARRRRGVTETARVTSSKVARTVEKLMLGVVRHGTGTSAAIGGVKVAGKTGTAELESTKRCEPTPDDSESCADQPADDPTDTDAWFAAYAPAGDGRPRVAVGVMLVRAGAGGDTAAPVARQVLTAALKR